MVSIGRLHQDFIIFIIIILIVTIHQSVSVIYPLQKAPYFVPGYAGKFDVPLRWLYPVVLKFWSQAAQASRR